MDKYLYAWLVIRGDYLPHDIANEHYSYEDIFNMNKEDLINKIKVSEKVADYIVKSINRLNIESEYEAFIKSKVKVSEYGDEDYPRRLIDIDNPPRALFYYGSLPNDDVPSVAIIGARKCSEYGRFMAEKLAEGLAKEGVQVISGMALGIDGLSQMVALEMGGTSFGVLGSGVDICYPRANKMLYDRLKIEGGVISEYPNRVEAKAGHFPLRNRIISGLSDGLIVVEAKQKSGTIITVDSALLQGRDIFVVPGRATDALSVGCNGLIKQGAYPVQCAEDVMEVLNNSGYTGFACKESGSNLNYDYKEKISRYEKNVKKILPEKVVLTKRENMVYSQIGFEPVTSTEMLNSVDMDFISMTGIIVDLEMRGLIKEVGRNAYVRNVL